MLLSFSEKGSFQNHCSWKVMWKALQNELHVYPEYGSKTSLFTKQMLKSSLFLHFGCYELCCNEYECQYLFEILILILLDKYPEMELLDHLVFLFFYFFKELPHSFPQQLHHFAFPPPLRNWQIFYLSGYILSNSYHQYISLFSPHSYQHLKLLVF